MASDNHASYARIGFTIIIGIVAIIGTLVYLGGLRGKGSETFLETYYDKPVSGLSVGSPVNFRGVKIGEVREIGFVGNRYSVEEKDYCRIYILMAIDSRTFGTNPEELDAADLMEQQRTMIERLGLRATVTSSGITGMSRMEIDYNLESPPPAPAISWSPKYTYIPAKISLLDSFSVAATKMMNQVNKMDFNAAWSNLNAAVVALSHATDSAKTMLESRQGDIERILDDMLAVSASVRDLVTDFRRNPSMLIRGTKPKPLDETE